MATLCALFMLSISALAQTTICSDFGPPRSCAAPTGGTGSSDVKDNKYYGGLVWELNGSHGFKPDLIVGYRSLLVKSDDTVNGGDFSLRFRFDGGITFDSTRLVYVGGRRDLMGNAGIGYSNTYKSPLFNVAVQGAYARLGADYLWVGRNELKFYFEVNSLAKPEAASDGGLRCASGILIDVAQLLFQPSPSFTSGGKTCMSGSF